MHAYFDLFETIIVEAAEPESVINYMIGKYGYSPPRAEEATSLFVYFCKKAKIPISKKLLIHEPKTRIRPTKRTMAPSRKKTTKKKPGVSPRETEFDESFATMKFDEFVFAVKKELPAIEFARRQVISMLDYLEKKLSEEKD